MTEASDDERMCRLWMTLFGRKPIQGHGCDVSLPSFLEMSDYEQITHMAHHGSLEFMQLLFDIRMVKYHDIQQQWNSALYMIGLRGHLHLIPLFVKMCVGFNLLHVCDGAVEAGNWSIIQHVITEYPDMINIQEMYKTFSSCYINNQEPIWRWIFDRYKNQIQWHLVMENILMSESSISTIREQMMFLSQLLLSEKIQVNWNYNFYKVCSRDASLVEMYIQNGASDFGSGLCAACDSGNDEVVKILAKRAGNVLTQKEWNRGVDEACDSGRVLTVKLISELHPDINWNKCLATACYSRHTELIDLSISKGANNWHDCIRCLIGGVDPKMSADETNKFYDLLEFFYQKINV